MSELSEAAAYLLLIVVPVACFWKRYDQRRSTKSVEQTDQEPFGSDAGGMSPSEKATRFVVRVPK